MIEPWRVDQGAERMLVIVNAFLENYPLEHQAGLLEMHNQGVPAVRPGALSFLARLSQIGQAIARRFALGIR